MNIYLIGFMGSGKSTVGKKLAAMLKWEFCDLDDLVVGQEGLSVAEIFGMHGESFFREAEKNALKTVASKSRLIVACGGGTPCNAENMACMKSSGKTIYLKMPVSSLISRLAMSDTQRPLLDGVGKEEMIVKIEDLLKLRSPWYEQADIIVNGVNADIKHLCRVVSALSE